MIYKVNEVKIVAEGDTQPLYNVEFIAYDNSNKYIIVSGDLTAFENDNPNAVKLDKLPLGVKFYGKKMQDNILDYKSILKNKVRNKINNEIGDIYDLLADLDKRVGMNERLLIRLANDILNNRDLSQNPYLQGYIPFLQQYVYAVDNGLLVGRNDLEDLNNMFTKLSERTTEIANIVKTEYLDKLQ